MNLGSGRIVYQEFTRINRAIETGEFAHNPAFQRLLITPQNESALHVMGPVPAGFIAMKSKFSVDRAAADAGLREIYLHAFLDGRDTPPRSAMASLQAAEAYSAS